MKNNQKIKLTQYSSGAGWACKINAKDLTQVLSKLKSINPIAMKRILFLFCFITTLIS